jgi:RNA polymerase sigma-70 factor (ECF subfamily)
MHQMLNGSGSDGADRQTVAELFSRHYAEALGVASKILRSRADAEDAVQAAYYSAFRNLASLRREASFRSWMFRTVVNCCLTEIRQRRSRPLVSADETFVYDAFVAPTYTPEALCAAQEFRLAHGLAVSQLSRSLREVYVLCALDGESSSVVARKLGLTTGAVRSRLVRARSKMVNCLRPYLRGMSA